MNGIAGLSSFSPPNPWVTGTHIWDLARGGTVTAGAYNGAPAAGEGFFFFFCGFSRSVLVPLEGRESAGGGKKCKPVTPV